jgi:hypothetical protein
MGGFVFDTNAAVIVWRTRGGGRGLSSAAPALPTRPTTPARLKLLLVLSLLSHSIFVASSACFGLNTVSTLVTKRPPGGAARGRPIPFLSPTQTQKNTHTNLSTKSTDHYRILSAAALHCTALHCLDISNHTHTHTLSHAHTPLGPPCPCPLPNHSWWYLGGTGGGAADRPSIPSIPSCCAGGGCGGLPAPWWKGCCWL